MTKALHMTGITGRKSDGLIKIQLLLQCKNKFYQKFFVKLITNIIIKSGLIPNYINNHNKVE